ncbi:S-adenosyl-L-methionine-dependent methyltransferase, partial [Pseudovirgaria hyperparasitica]
EQTFRSYTPQQGAAYAQYRTNYHETLYALVLRVHTSTGGKLNSLLDIGCGPGTATASLAPHFTTALGLDASEGMIATARELHPSTTSTPNLTFAVSAAESLGANLDPPVASNSVDLITAATAAHWFDMPGFWRAAARVVKPGGSVALWTGNQFRVHPDVPGAARIQARMDELNAEYLRAYFEPGTDAAHGLYRNLGMPWSVEPAVEEFERESVFRREWVPGKEGVGEEFFERRVDERVSLDVMERMMGTASPVTRWREANGGKVGTEEDVVRVIRREVERILREEGVEEGKEWLKASVTGVLLVVKKK